LILEHFIYTAALAVLAGMVYQRSTGRDPSWIMIVAAVAPDIDYFVDGGLRLFGFTLLFRGHEISHGNFHNILVAAVFAVAVAFLLHPFGVKFVDSVVFTSLAFIAHMVEDALVYSNGYAMFWPFSGEIVGIGWLPRSRTLLHLANPETLLIGLVLLAAAVGIRCSIDGSGWLRDNPLLRWLGLSAPSRMDSARQQ
jgi:hypothetical protein